MSSQSNDMPEGFKMTELGPIPKDWNAVKLDCLMKLRKESVLPENVPNIRYIGLEHIDSGESGIRRWGNAQQVRSAKSRFYPEDILYGKLRPYLDKAAIVEWEGVCSTDILVFSAYGDRAIPAYLANLLHTRPFVDHAIATTSGVNHPRTSWSSISSFTAPCPSLTEQKAIARVLSTIQKAIETQDKIIAAARELKKSLMRHLFTYGPVLVAEADKVPLKDTEIGLVPEHWEVKLLLDTATLQRGKDLPKQNQIPGQYPIVGSSGIIGYHNTFVCSGPGVVTGRSGSIGNLAYVEDNYWPHNTGLYVKDFHGNEPKFIYYLLHLVDFHKYATGVSVPTLNRNFVHSALVPVPPMQEQQQITNILTSVDNKIEVEENRKAALQATFKTMLHQLMTGKVRVKDLEALAA